MNDTMKKYTSSIYMEAILEVNDVWILTLMALPCASKVSSHNRADSASHPLNLLQVLRLTSDMKLQVIAGDSMRCSRHSRSNNSSPGSPAQALKLGPIVDIGFAQNGELYIAEKSVGKDYLIHKVGRDGRVDNIVGGGSGHSDKLCVCEIGNCFCLKSMYWQRKINNVK